MINLKQLLQNIEDAKDKVGLAEGDLHNAICPVLRELGVWLEGSRYITNVWCDFGRIYIATDNSWHDCESYNFPLAIFEAEDPIAAAKAYKKKQDDQEKKFNEDLKRQQLARLKKELGEE